MSEPLMPVWEMPAPAVKPPVQRKEFGKEEEKHTQRARKGRSENQNEKQRLVKRH